MSCRAEAPKGADTPAHSSDSPIETKLAQYTSVSLTTDLTKLSPHERQMLPLLIAAARSMDEIFWRQAYGDREALLRGIADPAVRRYAEINYGPWDRLNNNAPFIDGVGPKPPGSGFYPRDMTKEEFESAAQSSAGRKLRNQYTMVHRDSAGHLVPKAYHLVFAAQVAAASANLRKAATLAEDPGLRKYLELRARALETDEYQPSDLALASTRRAVANVRCGP